MAEGVEQEAIEEAEPSLETGAVAAALDEGRGDPELRPYLAAFFDAQRALIDAQKHHLHVQLGQLRLRIVGDAMKLTLQGLGLAALVGLLVMIGAIVRGAFDDHGLVIESFSAPPSLSAQGVSGQSLAEDMLGKLGAIRRTANANSITVSDDVRSGAEESLKVEVPQTGLSLEEIQRFLHHTFGHARRLSGDLVVEGERASLTLHLSGADPIVVTGPTSDLDGLLQRAAEGAFAAFDPTNIVLYLRGSGRFDEGLAAAERLMQVEHTRLERSNGLALWANSDGDRRRALARAQLSAAIAPENWAGWSETGQASRQLGHDEDALAGYRRVLATRTQDQWRNHREALGYLKWLAKLRIDSLLGAYGRLVGDAAEPLDHDPRSLQEIDYEKMEGEAGRHDCERAREDLSDAALTAPLAPRRALSAERLIALCRGDKAAVLDLSRQALADVQASRARAQAAAVGFFDTDIASGFKPQLALALLDSGDLAGAQAMIRDAPGDCYACLRARGRIAAEAADYGGAERWYAEAVRQAPSLPFAYLEWGDAKARRGNLAGASDLYRQAMAKAPVFADPLKAEGDIMAKQGRKGEAARLYAAAGALAPHWQALHQAQDALRR